MFLFFVIGDVPYFPLFTDIEVMESLHLDMGRCYTLNPLTKTKHSWKEAGFSIMLRHDTNNTRVSVGDMPPGWHVFIHDETEGFAGKSKYNDIGHRLVHIICSKNGEQMYAI